MSLRSDAEKEILYYIEQILPGEENLNIYKALFKRMDDIQFDDWIQRLDSGEEILAIYKPNFVGESLNLERNIKVAEDLGYPLFQHLYLTDPDTGMVRKTPVKFLTGIVPVRRQAQTLDNKMSIPESDTKIDQLTAQATGESKGARISYPELQVNLSKGLVNMVLEPLKFRAGDSKAYSAMKKSILETGSVSMNAIQSTLNSTVKVNESLRTILKAMHLNNNL